jgi:hypothetical protein
MKKLAIALLVIAAAAVAPAQSCRHYPGAYSYPGYYGRYSTRIGGITVYSTYPPDVYYVGRTIPNQDMPFAYGSFFYGQSWQQWERGRRRHRHRR